ncbi:MAG TPA: NAD(P)/FAD-dependent oxidoreductase [Segetibacter sp.]|jgi:flavin-dependent dehydrogenase
MSSAKVYDVAIIGGGLAGLSLAIQCADKGYAVVLFEKETYPFHKVCGEYISMESWNFLEALEVPLRGLKLPLINSLQASDFSGKTYNFELPLGGFGISRFLLDNSLYEIALKKGVEVLTSTKVNNISYKEDLFELTTNAGDYFSKVAAGSYGKRSNIDIKINRSFVQQKANKLNNYVGVKYHVRYPHSPDTIALHNFENGYCGISAVEEDKCCLCYLTTAENLQKAHNSIPLMEKTILSQNPTLAKIFSEAEFLYSQPSVISQISFDYKSQVEDHMLMIGDAAGMITPLCGNGMSMALHGSKIAFQSIDNFLQKKYAQDKMEKEYTGKWKRNFAKRLWIGRRVQQLFGGNTSTALFLKTMNAFPALAKQIIKSTHGEPY